MGKDGDSRSAMGCSCSCAGGAIRSGIGSVQLRLGPSLRHELPDGSVTFKFYGMSNGEGIKANRELPDAPPTHFRNRRIVAMITMLAGVIWLSLGFWGAVSSRVGQEDLTSGFALFSVLLPFFLIPGYVVGWFGYRLFHEFSETSLLCISGKFIPLACVSAVVRMGSYFGVDSQPHLCGSLGLLAILCLMAFLYPVANSKLLPLIGGLRKKAGAFVTKGFLSILAWILWFALNDIFRAFGLNAFIEVSVRIPKLKAMVIFAPVIVAYLVHAMAYSLFARPTIGDQPLMGLKPESIGFGFPNPITRLSGHPRHRSS
jgi:hypothetical protein